MKVIQPPKKLANDDSNVLFSEDTRFHLVTYLVNYIFIQTLIIPDRSMSHLNNTCMHVSKEPRLQ